MNQARAFMHFASNVASCGMTRKCEICTAITQMGSSPGSAQDGQISPQPAHIPQSSDLNGVPGAIRTHGPQIRNLRTKISAHFRPIPLPYNFLSNILKK